MKAFIPTTFFGYFNYVIAIITMSSPWLFEFINIGGASLFLPLMLGWFQLIMAIFSNAKGGMVGAFPVKMHCVLDTISGFVLMVSPWLYGFNQKGVFLPHLILGGIILALGLFTKGSPLTCPPHEMLQEGGITSLDSHEGRMMN